MRAENLSPILCFVSDLYFTTRVEKMAEALGYSVEQPGGLVGQPASLLIFDLDDPKFEALRLIRQARAEESPFADAPILAFGSHVKAERLRLAREAGANLAVPKSRFMGDMHAILRKLLVQD